MRYREALRRGEVQIDAALGNDDIVPQETRGYVFAEGAFAFGKTRLSFDVEAVTDDAYLVDYGITDRDLLRREIRIERVEPDRLTEARLTEFERLRAPRRRESAPNRQAEFRWLRRYPGALGGIAFADARALSYLRRSDSPVDGPGDPDTLPDGRDVTRAALALGWRGRAVTGGGVEGTALARLDMQAYAISHDAAFGGSIARAVPYASGRLAWPLRRAARAGTDVLEPSAQLSWRGDGGDVPLEEGTRPEFDSGNLFAPSRLPGTGDDPEGLRADLALGWTRYGPGYELGLVLGKSPRDRDTDVFADGTGLEGRRSDWLLEARLDLAATRAGARALLGEDGALTRAEARLAHDVARAALEAGYVYQSAAVQSDGIARPRVSELDMTGRVALRRGLDADMGLRYDFDAQSPRTALLGLTVEGDCARARLSAERRFSAGGGLSPETRFGLTVELTGIGGAPRRGPSACGPG